jgi:hypothetical protein
MNVSPSQSGYQLIQNANRLTEQAASDIATQAKQQADQTITPRNDIRTSNSDHSSLKSLEHTSKVREHNQIDPLIDLQRANQYSKVGTNIIQREQDMIGTLLDTSV